MSSDTKACEGPPSSPSSPFSSPSNSIFSTSFSSTSSASSSSIVSVHDAPLSTLHNTSPPNKPDNPHTPKLIEPSPHSIPDSVLSSTADLNAGDFFLNLDENGLHLYRCHRKGHTSHFSFRLQSMKDELARYDLEEEEGGDNSSLNLFEINIDSPIVLVPTEYIWVLTQGNNSSNGNSNNNSNSNSNSSSKSSSNANSNSNNNSNSNSNSNMNSQPNRLVSIENFGKIARKQFNRIYLKGPRLVDYYLLSIKDVEEERKQVLLLMADLEAEAVKGNATFLPDHFEFDYNWVSVGGYKTQEKSIISTPSESSIASLKRKSPSIERREMGNNNSISGARFDDGKHNKDSHVVNSDEPFANQPKMPKRPLNNSNSTVKLPINVSIIDGHISDDSSVDSYDRSDFEIIISDSKQLKNIKLPTVFTNSSYDCVDNSIEFSDKSHSELQRSINYNSDNSINESSINSSNSINNKNWSHGSNSHDNSSAFKHEAKSLNNPINSETNSIFKRPINAAVKADVHNSNLKTNTKSSRIPQQLSLSKSSDDAIFENSGLKDSSADSSLSAGPLIDLTTSLSAEVTPRYYISSKSKSGFRTLKSKAIAFKTEDQRFIDEAEEMNEDEMMSDENDSNADSSDSDDSDDSNYGEAIYGRSHKSKVKSKSSTHKSLYKANVRKLMKNKKVYLSKSLVNRKMARNAEDSGKKLKARANSKSILEGLMLDCDFNIDCQFFGVCKWNDLKTGNHRYLGYYRDNKSDCKLIQGFFDSAIEAALNRDDFLTRNEQIMTFHPENILNFLRIINKPPQSSVPLGSSGQASTGAIASLNNIEPIIKLGPPDAMHSWWWEDYLLMKINK